MEEDILSIAKKLYDIYKPYERYWFGQGGSEKPEVRKCHELHSWFSNLFIYLDIDRSFNKKKALSFFFSVKGFIHVADLTLVLKSAFGNDRIINDRNNFKTLYLKLVKLVET